MRFDPVGVDEPAQSIDPHDPHVRCWNAQWDGHLDIPSMQNQWWRLN